MEDVKSYLDNPAGNKVSPDIVSSRLMDCVTHGSWTEQVTKMKLGRGFYMLLPSRCPGCLKDEAIASAKDEAWLRSLKPGKSEWSQRR